MKVRALGHVVLKVTDIERSEQFYAGVLGLPVCARMEQPDAKMTFFSLGNHHDLAITQVPGAEPARGQQTGLHHVAFCIGDSIDQLAEARAYLQAAGIATVPIDHEVTKSLYFSDPDGNGVEVYVDASDAWRHDPQRVAQLRPLEL